MKFAILEDSAPDVPEPIKSTLKPTEVPPTEIPTITLENLIKAIIDSTGYHLACNEDLTLEEKIVHWVSLLKWAYPLIEGEHLKNQIQESIENPPSGIS